MCSSVYILPENGRRTLNDKNNPVKNPTLLILAAGNATRYGSLKQLDALGPNGETILDYSIRDALKAGFEKIVLLIKKDFQTAFEKKIVTRWENATNIEFAYQEVNPAFENIKIPKREKPWGTVHAVLSAKEKINTPFAVINADDYYGSNAFHSVARFLKQDNPSFQYALVGYVLKNTLSQFGGVSRGICKISENNSLLEIKECKGITRQDEKIFYPENRNKISLQKEEIVSMNFWGFNPDFFEIAEHEFLNFAALNAHQLGAEMTLPDVIRILLNQKKVHVDVLVSPDNWMGVTYREDREWVVEALKKKEMQNFDF